MEPEILDKFGGRYLENCKLICRIDTPNCRIICKQIYLKLEANLEVDILKTEAEFRGRDKLKLEVDLVDGILTLDADILKFLDAF